jgi:mxaL protein
MKEWLSGRDWRFWSLFAACVLLALCLFRPTVPWPRPVYRYLFVLDITQSMNARDYHVEGLPADRLGFVQASLRRVLHELPCGSEVGLGLFTTQHSQVLFEPMELCAHHAIVDEVIARIDWRMAWAADSHIAHGLYTGLRKLAESDPKVRLVFFSDGQQFPPQAERPPFHGKPGEVNGWIVGVGGANPVPIPRYDRENRPLGYWQYNDLEDWLPTSELAARPRHDSSPYLSRLDETILKELAAITGLGYHRLTSPKELGKALQATDLAERRAVPTDARPALAALALGLLLLPVLAGRLGRRVR